MTDLFALLRSYVGGMWGLRWYGLLCAWGACTIGWVITERLPDQYRSEARIFIDTESMLRPLMQGVAADLDRSVLAQLDVVQRTLSSRPNLQRVMRETDLDLQVKRPEDEDRIIGELESKLKVEGGRTSLFSISYTDRRPQLAHDVVQAVLNLFVESNLGANREELAVTQRFLDEQLVGLQRQLTGKEGDLARFEVEHRGYLPGTENFESELRRLRETLAKLDNDRALAVRDRDQLLQERAKVVNTAQATGTGTGAPTSPRITELEANLAQNLLRFTERHPDVVATRRLLEIEKSRLAATPPEQQQLENPLAQELTIQQRRSESTIAFIDQQIADTQARIATLIPLVERSPTIVSQHAQITRELDLIHKNYQEITERREKARFAGEIDARTESVQFRIIEPPKVPTSPAAPNRFLLRTAVLVGGLLCGLCVCLGLFYLSGTVSETGTLEKATGRPVIGVVTHIIDSRRIVYGAAEVAAFGAITLALFGAYALVVTEKIPIGFLKTLLA